MHHSINLHENITVSDTFRAETEVDAVVFRMEFEKHYGEYKKTLSEAELILCFIMLQIYIECFLHQNMRRIVGLEFLPPRDSAREGWSRGERKSVAEKLDGFSSLFFSSKPENIQYFTDSIKERLAPISQIRNFFVHGHKVSAWSDSEGNSGTSEARSFLTPEQLNKSIGEVNELGAAWNLLLENIQPQLKGLRSIDDFKYSKL
jgi:hypothetical protein